MKQDQATRPDGSEFSAELGPLPEPRMWYDHATQKCHGMAPTGGTNERMWDATDMQAYAAAEVAKARAAERERWRTTLEDASDKLFALREFCATRNGSDYRHIESEVHRMPRALKWPNL